MGLDHVTKVHCSATVSEKAETCIESWKVAIILL
jgi:hypothetical protein